MSSKIHSLIREVNRIAHGSQENKRGPVVVQNLRDEINSANGVSLRDAIALVPDGGTIQFDVEGTINLRLGPIQIDKELEIVGPGPGKLVISGGHNSRIFLIDDENDDSFADVRLSGLRLTAGVGVPVFVGSLKDWGGAINSMESLTVTDCQFANNHGRSFGGAVYAVKGQEVLLRRCSFIKNSANSGGAIAVAQVDSVLVDSCTFDSNRSSQFGSAMFSGGSNVHLGIRNSTFSSNSAAEKDIASKSAYSGNGGAIVVQGSETLIDHCTFTRNTGGAILGQFDTKAGTLPSKPRLSIMNSIIHGNVDHAGNPADLTVETGSQAMISHSIIGEAQGGFIDAGNNLVDIDPMLGPLADNGGPTKTIALLQGSPAIDAGGQSDLNVDQRGTPYVRIASPDIGAFELQESAIP